MFYFISILACSSTKEEPKSNSTCSYDNIIFDENTLSFDEKEHCQELTLSSKIFGDGEMSVTLVQQENEYTWKPIITAESSSVFEGFTLTGAYALQGDSPTRLWKQGYQSWWWSGVTALRDMDFDENAMPLVGGDGDGVSAKDETPYSSWWVGLVGKEDGDSLLIGALTSTKTKFWMAANDTDIWAVWGLRGEKIPLLPGETLELDPIFIRGGEDSYDLHVEYAQTAIDYINKPEPTTTPPLGWATWYTYYEDIDEEIIRSNLDVVVDLQQENSVVTPQIFQIDDGWQTHWGDWEGNEHFPSGMNLLAEDISNHGLTPGIWMAPFYVSVDANIFSEHEDWWVRDEDGEIIRFSNFAAGTYVIVDVTHPEAGIWMRDQVAHLKNNGWTYLKLDFLYAGAQEGKRYADVTGMEAYHIGMELLQDAVDDGFFLACGAPMLPSLPYADAFRTGADIGFGFDPGPRREYLRWQVRSTAARSWQNGIWWWNDPDQILTREPFDDIEVTGSVAANILSGGSWFLGDELFGITEDRLHLQLHPTVISKQGLQSRPLDPLTYISGPDLGPVSERNEPDDQVPLIWELEDGSIVMINLGDRKLDITPPSQDEFFSSHFLGTSGQVTELLPGQGAFWPSLD